MKKLLLLVLVFAWRMGTVKAALVSVSQPRLVATDPDGPCSLEWALDSRSVHLSPYDQRQNLQWGNCSLDAGAETSPSQAKTNPAAPALFEIEAGDDKQTSLLLTSLREKKTRPLQNTPWKIFGFEMLDSIESRWRFQDSHFSSDWRELSIIASGTIYTWSTATGKLLRQMGLTGPQSVDGNYVFASFSPDGRTVVSSLSLEGRSTLDQLRQVSKKTKIASPSSNAASSKAQPTGAALFDVHSGRPILLIPGTQGAEFWARFFVDNRLLLSQDRTSEGSVVASIWSVQQRRKLWSSPIQIIRGMRPVPRFNMAVVTTNKGIELRDLITGELQQTLAHPITGVNDVAPSPDGSQIWASYANGQIWAWRLH